ncbi:MAG: MOSC domain-containing protein [Janthinobacterium lividum]
MMLNPASPLSRLLRAPMRPGIVRWLAVRPARRGAMAAQETLRLDPTQGVEGDHYSSATSGQRHVTLISDTDLDAIGRFLGAAAMPEQLRRNIVVAGINLHALKGWRLRIGGAVLEATGACHPCSRMEQTLGTGGYNAVRGHGGITARVLSPGIVRLGDTVERLDEATN